MINESTLARLREGDASVVDSVIEEYIPLANKIARWFSFKHPRRRDDIHGSAMLGLVWAVHKIRKGVMRTENVKGYINAAIREHITRFLMSDHLIPVPKYYFLEHVDKMKQNEFLPIIYRIDDRRDDEENPQREHSLQYEPVAPEEGDKEFANEFYLRLTNRERMILEMRGEGYTQRKIGERLGITQQYVELILNKIRDKFIRERSTTWAGS